MNKAPVTVVIPMYNDGTWVAEAIASALTQTVPPKEIVVVDDGSTDGSGELVAARFGGAVKILRQANGGPSRARNAGVWAATEPYVAFLDADDVWVPDKLARQLPVLEAEPGIGTVAADWVRQAHELPASAPEVLPRTIIGYRDMLGLNRFQTSTVMTRTALLRAVGGFDPAVDGAEDWDLWVRLAQQAPIVKLDWPLVIYRDREQGYSKDVWRVYETMKLLLNKHRGTAPMSAAEFKELEAWHHLRFAVALALMHDTNHARQAAQAAFAEGRWPYAVKATATRLAPFLWGRLRRRGAVQRLG